MDKESTDGGGLGECLGAGLVLGWCWAAAVWLVRHGCMGAWEHGMGRAEQSDQAEQAGDGNLGARGQ
jgi:hypothetical protein